MKETATRYGRCVRVHKQDYGWVCREHGHAMSPPQAVTIARHKNAQLKLSVLGRMASK